MSLNPVPKYINPFTDFGFKKIFGEEANKILLIDFLNTILSLESPIKNLTYLKNEHFPENADERKAIFDLFCENELGEKFIVELQRAHQKNFKDRSLYYASFAIREQAKTKLWGFELKTVYVVSILNFSLDALHSKFVHRIGLVDLETNEVFNPHLKFVYLEIPKFTKSEKQLRTLADKWFFVLKNLTKLEKMPTKMQEDVFKHLFQVAEYLNLSAKEKEAYDESFKRHNDFLNTVNTSYEEGFDQGVEKGVVKGYEYGIEHGLEQGIEQGIERGIEQGILQILSHALEKGYKKKKIAKLTGLSPAQIKAYYKKHKH